MKAIRAINDSATLIRMLDGRVTFWSSGMEARYGFSATETFGQISHRLLRTRSRQSSEEIQAELVEQRTWCGGLIHYRADGRPTMAANYWHLHDKPSDERMLVTEVHADIVAPGTIAGRQSGDIMATIAQEMSQPVQAAETYVDSSQRALQPAWSKRGGSDRGLVQAVQQLARMKEVLTLLQGFGENLREFHRHNQRSTETGKREQEPFRMDNSVDGRSSSMRAVRRMDRRSLAASPSDFCPFPLAVPSESEKQDQQELARA